MFGELLGLWAAEVWAADGLARPRPAGRARARPRHADGRRAAGARGSLPGFRDAGRRPSRRDEPGAPRARRHAPWPARRAGRPGTTRLDDVPRRARPSSLANEFFDALPIRQFVRDRGLARAAGRARRRTARSPSASRPSPSRRHRREPAPGDVLETCRRGRSRSCAASPAGSSPEGGAALVVDYGHVRPGFGDTLQAVRGHALRRPARRLPARRTSRPMSISPRSAAPRPREGAPLHGPVDQGDFLRALGMRARAERLVRGREPAQRDAITAASTRLTDRPGAAWAPVQGAGVRSPRCRRCRAFRRRGAESQTFEKPRGSG